MKESNLPHFKGNVPPPDWEDDINRQRIQHLKGITPERMLRELLALIHGDGGHHTEKVGLAQSVFDAEENQSNREAVKKEILTSRYHIQDEHIDWMNEIIKGTNPLFIKPREVCLIYQMLTEVWADDPIEECYTVISHEILHHVKDFAIRDVFDKINSRLNDQQRN